MKNKYFSDTIAKKIITYFLHRQEITEWSPATILTCYSGIKFRFMT